jgi:hypothetical protein
VDATNVANGGAPGSSSMGTKGLLGQLLCHWGTWLGTWGAEF